MVDRQAAERKANEADINKFVKFAGTGVVTAFDTRIHEPFELMCGYCYFVGMTDAKESDKSCSILGCICLYEIPEIPCKRWICPKKLHRTDHYCANCGSHLAYATYGKSSKIRGLFNGWAVAEYEGDLEADWKDVRA